MGSPRAVGRPYRRARDQCLATSDVCHWCGHGGADTADHVIPRARGGAVADPDNLAPIHGVRGCPTCGRKCNSEKGARLDPPRPVKTSRAW